MNWWYDCWIWPTGLEFVLFRLPIWRICEGGSALFQKRQEEKGIRNAEKVGPRNSFKFDKKNWGVGGSWFFRCEISCDGSFCTVFFIAGLLLGIPHPKAPLSIAKMRESQTFFKVPICMISTFWITTLTPLLQIMEIFYFLSYVFLISFIPQGHLEILQFSLLISFQIYLIARP